MENNHLFTLPNANFVSSSPSSRRNSLASDATSHRRMISESNSNTDSSHPPLPSGSHGGGGGGMTNSNSNPSSVLPNSTTNLLNNNTSNSSSLTVNYLPRKFSSTMLDAGSHGARRRKNTAGGFGAFSKLGGSSSNLAGTTTTTATGMDLGPKRGGGVEAFRSGEARMPLSGEADDEDYYHPYHHNASDRKKKPKWNRFKWTLFGANLIFTIYALTGLIVCLMTWFNVPTHADVIRVGNRTELVLCTLAATTGLFTSAIGWAGILLNNRSFLAIYALLTWITFALLVTPGYVAYKKRAFNLEGKINAQWSRELDSASRMRIQNELQCCGYYNPFIEATVSATCYSRSLLPGCKKPYLLFERKMLQKFYTLVFGLVPVQLGIMVVALLCSNHVTYRFGKGMTPKAYRLDLTSVAMIMDQYASQLAEQYGQDVASQIMAKSRANLLQFDTSYQSSSLSRASSRTRVGKNQAGDAKRDSVESRETTGATLGEQGGTKSKPSGWF